MALDIFWSKQAAERFDSIIEYLDDIWGEHSVSLFVKKVHDFLKILSEFPEIGSLENKGLNIRGFVIIKQITIFYQIRDKKIILLNFYDNRQKPSRKKH
ncbi:MAG: type II toxin-antitoxin system RelE/ParE family toxin [Bacteroidia bacterium]|nr:type II toxin-antitoxin system RelE/ParE family toxin [Bacteroidia bacterium]